MIAIFKLPNYPSLFVVLPGNLFACFGRDRTCSLSQNAQRASYRRCAVVPAGKASIHKCYIIKYLDSRFRGNDKVGRYFGTSSVFCPYNRKIIIRTGINPEYQEFNLLKSGFFRLNYILLLVYYSHLNVLFHRIFLIIIYSGVPNVRYR